MGLLNYQGTADDGILDVGYMRISEVESGADVTDYTAIQADAQTKANAAEAAAKAYTEAWSEEGADVTQNVLDLGAAIDNAKANGNTLIYGGFIRTSLINASAIVIGDLSGAGSLAGLDQTDLSLTPSDNQIPNPDFELGLGGWVIYNTENPLETSSKVILHARTDTPYGKLLLRATGAVNFETQKYIPVSEGKTYFGEIWARPASFDSVDTNIRFYAGVRQYDYDKVFITNNYFIASNVTITSYFGWRRYTGTFTVPTGTSYIRAMGLLNYQGTADDGILDVGYMRISEVESGADVTSKNTAADTNLVGGVPSGTVAGWRYGSTTYINGGNIYTNTITANQIAANSITAASGIIANAAITNAKIADLAVDTLKLAEQAVTIPVASYTAAWASVGTAWTTVQSATIVSTGASIVVTAALVVNLKSNGLDEVIHMKVRILKGDSVIWGDEVMVRSWAYNEVQSSVSIPLINTPGSGSTTYTLQVIYSGGVGTCSVGSRSITLLEVKK
jgi:hypothetical protein